MAKRPPKHRLPFFKLVLIAFLVYCLLILIFSLSLFSYYRFLTFR